MKKLLTATILASMLAVPAFAQNESVTCAEFMAMNPAEKAGAIAALGSSDGTAEPDAQSTASVNPDPAPEELNSEDDVSAPGPSNDGMSNELAASGDASTNEAGSDDMATADPALAEGPASDDLEDAAGTVAKAVIDACAARPDVPLADVIEQQKFD